ncbi:hypothetical protein ACUODJ_55495, partial [Escherichia sp. HC-CC]
MNNITTLRCAMCRSCYQGGAVAYITASNKKPDMQSQTNIHNVFLFTTINNSITIIEMNDDLY